jgi:hypothetical protein
LAPAALPLGKEMLIISIDAYKHIGSQGGVWELRTEKSLVLARDRTLYIIYIYTKKLRGL